MTTDIHVALFNYQDGGLRADGRYDFRPLADAFSKLLAGPDLILFCEGKRYGENGKEALCAAAEALSDELGAPYVAELGWMARAPMPPAIFYDSRKLVLRRWQDANDPAPFLDKANVARFAIRGGNELSAPKRTEFLAWVRHFDPGSGAARLQEATQLDRYGSAESLPVIGGGDLNATASGLHLPQRDWLAAGYRARTHKGTHWPVDGTWSPDSAAVDHLIGWYDELEQCRVDGCGYHAVAELAWQANPDMPILPTVNDGVDAGGGLLIDWLLVNDAAREFVVPESYQVHVARPGLEPSDHRLVTATLRFPSRRGAAP